jgi:hypothetical protein
LPLAKEDIIADPLTDAVAPVNMREGGYFEPASTPLRRRGKVACEKRKAPLLKGHTN